MPFNTAFPGLDYSKILIPEYREIGYSRRLHPFADATEGGTIGLRQPAEVDFQDVIVAGHDKREHHNMVQFNSRIPMLESSIKRIQTINYLVQTGHHNQRFRSVEDIWINLVENTAAHGAAADGSSLVCSQWALTIEKENRLLDWMTETRLFLEEMEWLLGQTAAGDPGGASGSPIPMDAQAYSRDEFEEFNLVDITWNALSIGVHGNPSLKLATESPELRDNRNRTTKGWVNVEAEVMIMQDTAEMMKAMYTAGQKDLTMKWLTNQGETFQMTTGMASLIGSIKLHEGEYAIPARVRGRTPNTSTYVVFNQGTKTLELKRVTVS